MFVIGIDLHGTLLNDSWQIEKSCKKKLLETLANLKGKVEVYICSGNDLTFIDKYVPKEVQALMSGAILETGCVVSDFKEEKIIVSKEEISKKDKLKESLLKYKFPHLKYYARRLSTISMFTMTEEGGVSPFSIYDEVKNIVEDSGFKDDFLVTTSNVAVDIIPMGYNKFTGINFIAGSSETMCLADSLNDFDLVNGCDYSFLPANSSKKLISNLRREMFLLRDFSLNKQSKGVYLSEFNNTKAVLEVLQLLDKHLK